VRDVIQLNSNLESHPNRGVEINKVSCKLYRTAIFPSRQ